MQWNNDQPGQEVAAFVLINQNDDLLHSHWWREQRLTDWRPLSNRMDAMMPQISQTKSTATSRTSAGREGERALDKTFRDEGGCGSVLTQGHGVELALVGGGVGAVGGVGVGRIGL